MLFGDHPLNGETTTLEISTLFAKIGQLVIVNEEQAKTIAVLRQRVAELEAQRSNSDSAGHGVQ